MQRLTVTLGVVALAGLLGWTSYTILSRQAADPFADCRSGNVAGGSLGGPFTLVDEAGRTVTEADVLAKPALIYFGFASCADVCPLDNARNVEAAALLAAKGQSMTPIFISLDPGRDTPAVLAEYTDVFGADLLGLTGTPEQIKAAADAYRVFYQIPENPSGDYSVDHTTFSYLMLPGGSFGDFFPRETTAQEIADRAGCFLQER
jgi:protein SCO1